MPTEPRPTEDEPTADRPFDDHVLRSLRLRQRELLEVLVENVRDPLMPYLELGSAPEADVTCERALRERIEQVIAENALLQDYLGRSRRSRFAELRRRVIEGHYLELAGDAPAGMDEELSFAASQIDVTVAQPTYEEISLLARIVPLAVWADQVAPA